MIYVFKTSVSNKKAVLKLKPLLNKIINEFAWNFDLEDCDNILRLDTCARCSTAVVQLLWDKGFECIELDN
ncbi:MAG: hypothetical protein EOO07_03440 [Chitinophagaceae bacterium]|nr:MAG: hypothetical protein EOO07_03440 [Chitinophagaceae bacterium]